MISIVVGSIFCGFITLLVASKQSQMVMATKNVTLMRVPMISALAHPKVILPLEPYLLILSERIDIPNPSMSEPRCAVSVKMAIELARYPPVS